MIHGIAPEDLDWAIASSQSYYSDAIGAELCEMFEIPDALASGLMTTLEAAAAELVINSDASLEARRRVSQKLVRLYKSLEATSVHLKDMDDEAWRIVSKSNGFVDPSDGAYHLRRNWIEELGDVEVVLQRQSFAEDELGTILLSSLFELLDGLKTSVSSTLAWDEAHRSKGRPKYWPFTQWLRAMTRIWERDLGRKFTFDEQGGAALSDAARFCVAAYQPLKPDRSEKEIVNKLRYYLKKERELRNSHK